MKRPQIGAKGLVYVKYNSDGSFKSSVDKFFSSNDLFMGRKCGSKPGDLILVLSGNKKTVQKQLNELRLLMGSKLNLEIQKFTNQFG